MPKGSRDIRLPTIREHKEKQLEQPLQITTTLRLGHSFADNRGHKGKQLKQPLQQ